MAHAEHRPAVGLLVEGHRDAEAVGVVGLGRAIVHHDLLVGGSHPRVAYEIGKRCSRPSNMPTMSKRQTPPTRISASWLSTPEAGSNTKFYQ